VAEGDVEAGPAEDGGFEVADFVEGDDGGVGGARVAWGA